MASSAESPDNKDLLSVVYTRVQKSSPDFMTIYGGIDQSLEVKISTFIFRLAPEPVLALYDFIMTTFVSQRDTVVEQLPDHQRISVPQASARPHPQGATEKIRVSANLATVQGHCPICILAVVTNLRNQLSWSMIMQI